MNDIAKANLFEQQANVLLRLRTKTLTHEQKVQAVIEHFAQGKILIQNLMLESPDNRCNLAQSEEMAGDIFVNMRGYLKDYQAGKESEPTHEDCCTCQKCMGERYPCAIGG